jgi:hypothetical protein
VSRKTREAHRCGAARQEKEKEQGMQPSKEKNNNRRRGIVRWMRKEKNRHGILPMLCMCWCKYVYATGKSKGILRKNQIRKELSTKSKSK